MDHMAPVGIDGPDDDFVIGTVLCRSPCEKSVVSAGIGSISAVCPFLCSLRSGRYKPGGPIAHNAAGFAFPSAETTCV